MGWMRVGAGRPCTVIPPRSGRAARGRQCHPQVAARGKKQQVPEEQVQTFGPRLRPGSTGSSTAQAELLQSRRERGGSAALAPPRPLGLSDSKHRHRAERQRGL